MPGLNLTILVMMATIIGSHTCFEQMWTNNNCGPKTTTLSPRTKMLCEAYPSNTKCPKVKPSDCLKGIKNVDCQACSEGTYIGETSKTASGLTCQAWNVQTPHKHEYARLGAHNHCRNPDGKNGVWCFTTNPEKRWEECAVRECNSCDDKSFSNATFCSSYRNGHTMLKYEGGPSEECTKRTVFRGLTEAEKTLIVKVHNELRQKVASGQETYGNQPGASNMMKLVWNDEIAVTAQRWADQCKGGHDEDASKCEGTWVGQNFFANIGPKHENRDRVYANVEKGIRAWYNEVTYAGGFPSSYIKSFNFEKLKKYGHYTQVVWAETSEVGCGLVYFKGDEQSMQSMAKPAFSFFDKDGSGYLSTKEFMKYSTKLKENVLQALMIHLDTDGDKQLSLEEFSVLYTNRIKNERFKYETHFVCNYAVGGNSDKQMYKEGKGCSDCPKGTTCDQTYDSLCSGKCDDPMCKQ